MAAGEVIVDRGEGGVSHHVDVVVVGAGPVGLTLAIQARLMGATVRVLDRLVEPRPWAPALAIHARTMEVLRGLGVMGELLERGVSRPDLTVHFAEASVEGRLYDLNLPTTEFPLVLFAPQPDLETVLRDRLSVLGVDVEWGSEFVDLDQDEDAVHYTSGRSTGADSCRYLVGCDGAGSRVRTSVGIPFPGRAYGERIVVADVAPATTLETCTAHAFVTAGGMVFFFPLASGRWRLIAPYRSGSGSAEDVPGLVAGLTDGAVRLVDVEWVDVITLRHHLARRYRAERVFLAGDAAHVHSPAGAQGMNTGIQDAVNLGWKLGMVLRGARPSLLDTYETERRRVARQVVRLTGVAFALEVSDVGILNFGRARLARPVATLFLPRPRLVSLVARTVSGLDTRYRHGAISAGGSQPSSAYRPGRRLPDRLLGDGPRRLHGLIDGNLFVLLVVTDEVSPESLQEMEGRLGAYADIRAISRNWLPRACRPPTYLLVRPDGYIAASGRDARLEGVRAFVDEWVGDEEPPTLTPAQTGLSGSETPSV